MFSTAVGVDPAQLPAPKDGNRPNSDLRALVPMNLGYHGFRSQAKQMLRNGLLSTAKKPSFRSGTSTQRGASRNALSEQHR